jgi:hypothetical protein
MFTACQQKIKVKEGDVFMDEKSACLRTVGWMKELKLRAGQRLCVVIWRWAYLASKIEQG